MTDTFFEGAAENDSDSESVLNQPRRPRVLSSSDSDDGRPNSNIECEKATIPADKGVNKFGFKSKLITDSDVEYENDSDNNGGVAAGSPERQDHECLDSYELGKNETKPELPKRKTKKKSTKKSLDDKLAIKSETQRMEREMTVNLPYHRPKQRSLREFLSRKKSQLDENSLRLSSPNMLHTWACIDKSIKETTEFFKSESEDEVEEELEQPAVLNTHSQDKVEEIGAELCNSVNPSTVNPDIDQDVRPQEDCLEKNDFDRLESIADIPIMSHHEKASEWLNDVAAYERRAALKNKLQISPTILNKIPILSNDLDDFVELEEPSQTTEINPGVQLLMNRLFKGLENNANTNTQCLTTTFTERDEFGNIKNIGVETTTLAASAVIVENEKPGVKRQRLKENLRMEIEAKWEKGYKERCAQEPIKDGFEDNIDENIDELPVDEEPEEYDLTSESKTDSSEGEDDEDERIIEKPRKFCQFGDSEAEVSDDDAGCEGDDETDKDDDENLTEFSDKNSIEKSIEKGEEELDCSMLPAFQPGGGFSMGGSVLTQQSQPLPIKPFSPLPSPANCTQESNRIDPGTPLQTDNPIISQPVIDHSLVKKNLFADETTLDCEAVVEDVEDPFSFVSGAFPDEVHELATGQSRRKRIMPADESEDSRGVESTHEPEADDAKSTLGESRVLEDDDDDDAIALPIKKKNKQLVFSDDEEDAPLELDTCENNDAVENDEPDVGIDDVNYDSEENEMLAGEFFEKEAELSESEWSGDEDEQGLDALEAEAGDADVFDEDQVASKLGRIHMRHMQDEDVRDVRRLQEILFEDGDLYEEGGPRERNYRWKNLSGFDWSSVYKGDDAANGDVIEPSDRAKLRFEKKQFLLKAQQEGKLQEVEELDQDKSSVLGLGRQMLERLQPQSTTVPSKALKMLPRGSFLTKDKNFLSRIARVTTGGNDAPLLGASHSKNFSFAVQEKSENIVSTTNKEGCKRKAVTYRETVKRCKLSNADLFLDQLRPTETTPI